MINDKITKRQLDDSKAVMNEIDKRRKLIKDKSDRLKTPGERYQNIHDKTSEKMRNRKI